MDSPLPPNTEEPRRPHGKSLAEVNQGIDGNKKTEGRKWHLITDTFGLVPAIPIAAAKAHDITGGKLLPGELVRHIPAPPGSEPKPS